MCRIFNLALNLLMTEGNLSSNFITRNTCDFTSPEQCLFTNIGTDWSSFNLSAWNLLKLCDFNSIPPYSMDRLTNWDGIIKKETTTTTVITNYYTTYQRCLTFRLNQHYFYKIKYIFYQTREQTFPAWNYSRVHFISQIIGNNQSVNIGCISDAVNLGCMNPFKSSSLGWPGEKFVETLLVSYYTLVLGSENRKIIERSFQIDSGLSYYGHL